MSGVYKMGGKQEESEFASFSLRIPRSLAAQIDARRFISKRSRNKEIQLLLERQIESEVERDKKIMEQIARINSSQNNPS